MNSSDLNKAVYVGKNTQFLSYGQTGEVLYSSGSGSAFKADGSVETRAVNGDDLLFTGCYRTAMTNPHHK